MSTSDPAPPASSAPSLKTTTRSILPPVMPSLGKEAPKVEVATPPSTMSPSSLEKSKGEKISFSLGAPPAGLFDDEEPLSARFPAFPPASQREPPGPPPSTRLSAPPPPSSRGLSFGPQSTRGGLTQSSPGFPIPPSTMEAPPPSRRGGPPASTRGAPPGMRTGGFPPISTKGTLPSSVQKALVTLDKLKAKLDALEQRRKEPIAIVGMACRFPGGASSPNAFFRLLEQGVDAITEVPPARWPLAPRTSDSREKGARWGGFLREDVGLFEPSFFGLSPREAERLDPQQRILLELVWEALERAGQVPPALIGSRTGVFLGLMTTDYMLLSMERPKETWDAYTVTGGAHCFPAGRIAYTFGFQGPTMVVDTACSSSLVAVHSAIQSLRSEEADMAIAGGMNLMLSPLMSEMTSKTNALAPDGRCKTFDARANGYVRGEGGAVVVLKRLSDAERDGDPILALLRGSAVNQDGRSTGMTTPNVLAQQAMLRQALANGRVSSEEIGFIETHGTGTSLGDPIEVEALRAVLGVPRMDATTCALGAVKTNIGHLEAAAGMAGLLKAIMALRMEMIPKNLHLRALNPRISLEGTPLVIPVENRPWPREGKPRIAGVSSFGLSGTNAHVLVEEAPIVETKEPPPELSGYLLPLSAKSKDALIELAQKYVKMLAEPKREAMYDIMYTAALRRMHHEHRLAVTGRSLEEIRTALSRFSPDELPPGVSYGKAVPPARQKIVFVFPGLGAQWIGMGRQLFNEEPAFRASMELLADPIRRHGTFSLLGEIEAREATSRLSEIDVVQPMLFAIQVSLAALWRSWGIEPDVVIGHSMGEVAAAHVAGILSAEDAVKVICRRSRMLVRIAGLGAMAQVELTTGEAYEAIEGLETALSVAAHNGPRSTVLSGDPTALDIVLAKLDRQGVFNRRISSTVAGHSPQTDLLLSDLAAVLFNLRPKVARIPMISTVTAQMVRGPELDANYWSRNLRETVQFCAAVQKLLDDREAIFIEQSPHPTLVGPIQDNLRDRGHEGLVVGSFKRNTDERLSALSSFASLYVRGAAVAWKGLCPVRGKCVELPSYPFHRQRYWLPDSPQAERPSWAPVSESRSGSAQWITPEWRASEIAKEPLALGPLLVIEQDGAATDGIARLAEQRNIVCVRARTAHRTRKLDAHLWEIDAEDPEAYVTLLREAFGKNTPCWGIVHAASAGRSNVTNITEIDGAQRVGTESALLLVQALLRIVPDTPPRLWLVTRGAVATSPDAFVNVAQAPLWGFGRTLQTEHPELHVKLIDLDPAGTSGSGELLRDEIVTDDPEDQVAHRSGGRLALRFAPMEDPPKPTDTLLSAGGTYLITGGLGGLGLSFAEWMVRQGARHLVLVGRSGPTQAANNALARIKARGAEVTIVAADISVRAEVLLLMKRIDAELPPLAGIIHCATILDDHPIYSLSVTSMREVAAAKMVGAWHLHEATLRSSLSMFVLFSSAASILGPPGQANYAAANAFVDALAHQRRALGKSALVINWGPFAIAGGLVGGVPHRVDRLAAMGVRSMSPTEAHATLGALLGPLPDDAFPIGDLGEEASEPPAPPQVAILDMDIHAGESILPRLGSAPEWSLLRQSRERPSRLEGTASQRSAVRSSAESPPSAPRKTLLEMVHSASPSERRAILEQAVRSGFARIARMDASQVELKEPLHQYGFDSLMALELRNHLQTSFGIGLSVGDVVANARIDALAEVLADRLSMELNSRPGEEILLPSQGRKGSWIVVPRPSVEARARLFCFPYAGGSAAVFSGWPASLSPDIEVCAIELPGRHARQKERFSSSVEEIVSGLLPELRSLLDKPFALFGHCLGAIVMFEALRKLRAENTRMPLCVFASAAAGPERYLAPTSAPLSDGEFISLLRLIGLAEEKVLTDQDATSALLPAVRSDFNAAASYSYTEEPPLDVPITTFSGLTDTFAPQDLATFWSKETTRRMTSVTFPGGHYFIVPEHERVLAEIRQELLYHLASEEQEQRAISRAAEGKASPYLVRTAPLERPRMRLFLLPAAFQSTADPAPWTLLLPGGVEPVLVAFPGRGERRSELSLGSVRELARHVSDALDPLCDVPFVLFGADLGALVAFETALALQRRGRKLPKHLIVSSVVAPSLHHFPRIHSFKLAALLATLRSMGVVPSHSLEDAIRADAAALAEYSYAPEPPLAIPITAFLGRPERIIAEPGARAWARHTSSGFTFLHGEDPAAIMDAVFDAQPVVSENPTTLTSPTDPRK